MSWTSEDTKLLAMNDDPGEDLCQRAAKEIERLNKLIYDRTAGSRNIGDAGNGGYEIQTGSRYTSR